MCCCSAKTGAFSSDAVPPSRPSVSAPPFVPLVAAKPSMSSAAAVAAPQARLMTANSIQSLQTWPSDARAQNTLGSCSAPATMLTLPLSTCAAVKVWALPVTLPRSFIQGVLESGVQFEPKPAG